MIRTASARKSIVDTVRVNSRNYGPAVPPVQLLPGAIRVRELSPAAEDDEAGALVALGERDLAPVRIGLTDADQHCLVVGDGGAGKSTFLRTWILVRRRGGSEMVQVLQSDDD